MRILAAFAVAAALAGCGVDSAGSAATAASLKKQELEQGRQTMQQMQGKINSAMQQVQEHAADAEKQ